MYGRSLVPPVLSCRSLVLSLIPPRSVAEAPRGPDVDSGRSPVPPVLSFGSLVLPRSYRFPLGTSATSKRKLIGNAVCPPIAKSLLLAIRETLLT
jgi:hypothetical protein